MKYIEHVITNKQNPEPYSRPYTSNDKPQFSSMHQSFEAPDMDRLQNQN